MPQARELPWLGPRAIGALGVLAALAVGAVTSRKPELGVAAAVGIAFVPLVLFELPLSLGVWVALGFLAGIPGLKGGPTATSVLIGIAWIGTLGERRAHAVLLRESARWALGLFALFCSWVVLSIAWSPKVGPATQQLGYWAIALAAFVVIVTAVERERTLRIVIVGFVVGGVLAVIAGLAVSGLDPAQSAIQSAAGSQGRLQSGSSDPNYLAATLVPGLALVYGLLGGTRSVWWRTALAGAAAVLLYGLVATESRGGFVALVVSALVALAVCRGRRLPIAAVIASGAALLLLFLALSPGAATRLSHNDGGGNGRSELWRIALRITGDHPIVGGGLGSFVTLESSYARGAGTVQFPDLIVDDPKVVHNLYLQQLAETGIVGLALLLAAIGACLAAGARAARGFRRRGDAQGERLAQALLVAQIGTLSASFFISNGSDRRLWILLALGPAMAALAARPGAPRTGAAPASRRHG